MVTVIICIINKKLRYTVYAIRWEQLEKWHFSRGFNFWTNDLILILKTPTGPYSCLAKVYVLLKTRESVLFISYRLMKNVRFWTVPIWLLHTVALYYNSLIDSLIIVMIHELLCQFMYWVPQPFGPRQFSKNWQDL